MTPAIFTGVIPALMTPCTADRKPDFEALVRKARELIEAELFGADAGAYTGANRAREGKFEAADRGTLIHGSIGDFAKAYDGPPTDPKDRLAGNLVS